MTKTVYSTEGRRGYFKVVVSAAMVTALATLTTAEEIDLSSVVEMVEQNQQAERAVSEDFVIGDRDAIVSADDKLSGEGYTCTMYYTQGKESLGTDTLDPYTDLIRAIHENPEALPVQFKWAVGGDTGDEEEATSATDCYITAVSKPVVGAQGKVKVSFAFRTSPTVVSVI